MNDKDFPPLQAANRKSKGVDTGKMFNSNVKHIFSKMVDGKEKGVKEFYEEKRKAQNTPKTGQAWVSKLVG